MGYTGYTPAVQSFLEIVIGNNDDWHYTPAATFVLGLCWYGIMMINQCLLSDKVCHASAKDHGKFHGDAMAYIAGLMGGADQPV